MAICNELSVSNLFSLQGKTVLATGATGGLGAKMCQSLAEAGANIVSIQLPNDSASPVFEKSIHSLGRRVTIFECNITDSTQLRETFARIWKAGVIPDILLNCAGLNRRGPIECMSDVDIDLIFSVNLKAAYVVAQEFGRELLRLKRPGKIINIGSFTSYLANTHVSAYACSKGGVLQMTKAFSNEWACKGIQVNCICPGYMETPFTTNLTEGDQYYKYIIDRTPAGRWGKPEDLRGAVIFLASPASNFITGSSILVDGGMLAK